MTGGHAGRRIVSISLPQFPMERWRRMQERAGNAASGDVAMALSVEGPHGPVVHAANRAAHLAGVSDGARVVDMRALCPTLQVEYADTGGDRVALDRLALWARRWCPWTAVDGQGLILDTTGTAHLWGGEAAMLADMTAQLALLGLTARVALAPTWGGAWALARFGPVRAISADPTPLPVAALRLTPDTVLLLHRLGLKTIGALAAVPRLALARRFARAELAANPLLRLDQMTGHLPEPLAPPDAPPVFRAMARLAEPIFDPTHHLPGLCADLCAQLAAAGHGARRLRLTVYRTDGEVALIDTATASPSRDAAHLAFLFRDRLDRIDPGFGFDLIALEAPVAEPMAVVQANLAGGTEAVLDLSHLVDRLIMRFGAAALSRPMPRASHIPERAEMRAAPLAAPPPLATGRGSGVTGDPGPMALVQAAGLSRMASPPSPPAGEQAHPAGSGTRCAAPALSDTGQRIPPTPTPAHIPPPAPFGGGATRNTEEPPHAVALARGGGKAQPVEGHARFGVTAPPGVPPRIPTTPTPARLHSTAPLREDATLDLEQPPCAPALSQGGREAHPAKGYARSGIAALSGVGQHGLTIATPAGLPPLSPWRGEAARNHEEPPRATALPQEERAAQPANGHARFGVAAPPGVPPHTPTAATPAHIPHRLPFEGGAVRNTGEAPQAVAPARWGGAARPLGGGDGYRGPAPVGDHPTAVDSPTPGHPTPGHPTPGQLSTPPPPRGEEAGRAHHPAPGGAARGMPPSDHPAPPPPAERPVRLLDPPEEVRVLYAVPEGPPAQFAWRRVTHRTVRYQGPERIAPEWWQDRPGTRLRDYFKVEDDTGRRYWLYREGLHDDGRGGDPRWFLHGIFA